MNTKFTYLYRDAANYKSWGHVIVAGEPTDAHTERLREACRAIERFVADDVDLPPLFRYTADDPESRQIPDIYDHGWHEFHGLESTTEPLTDPHDRSIDELVSVFERAAEKGWDPVRESDF